MVFRKGIYDRLPRIGVYELVVVVIIALAIGVRVVLVASGWPVLDSDEGTMGLMGMHIAFNHERPPFFYAQGYMGSSEAYLAAIMFRFFEISVFNLRIGLIFIFALVMLGMYLLTSLLYTKKLALFTLLLLALGSAPMLTRELIAVGGVPETWLAGTLLLLLTAWLALSSTQDATMCNQWRRLAAYVVWGLATGFGLWSHMLIAPFILLGGFILLLFCRRELLSWAPVCLLLGLLLGAAPLIYYNLTAPPGRDTLFYAMNAVSAGGTPPLPWQVRIPMQLQGALQISLPAVTGANPLCYGTVAEVPLWRVGSLYDLRCTLVHSVWPLAIILLWAVAVALALLALWRLRSTRQERPQSVADRRAMVQHWLRLALLANGAIPLLLYIASPNSAFYPIATSRYLAGLLMSIPAVLWPLWNGGNAVKPLALKLTARLTVALHFAQISLFTRRFCLVLVAGVFLSGLFSTFTGFPPSQPVDRLVDVYYTQVGTQFYSVPVVQDLNRQESALVADLLRFKATHIYSDYWTCARLIFQSRERILCGVLQDNLQPGHNRYPPYRAKVEANPHAAYVFYVGSPQERLFAQRMASSEVQFQSYKHYQRRVLHGYVAYLWCPTNNCKQE